MHKSIHSLWSVEKWLHFEEFWQVSVVVVKKLTLLKSWKKRGLSFSLQLIILKKRTLHRLNVSFRSFVEFTFTVSYLTNVGKISTDCTSTRLTGLFVSQSICFLSNFSHLTQQSQIFFTSGTINTQTHATFLYQMFRTDILSKYFDCKNAKSLLLYLPFVT